MAKRKIPVHNDFCPQALYLYGTTKEDGTPNFGLFCWFSYTSMVTEDGEEMGVMCCIGGDKLTKDLILKNGIFSANLVSEEMLPLADYYGCVNGRENPDKMRILPTVEQGQTLPVPTIAESPVSYELRVVQEIKLGGGSSVFLCRIAGVTAKEELLDKEKPLMERFLWAAPVLCPGEERYCSVTGRDLGLWGEPMQKLTEQK